MNFDFAVLDGLLLPPDGTESTPTAVAEYVSIVDIEAANQTEDLPVFEAQRFDCVPQGDTINAVLHGEEASLINMVDVAEAATKELRELYKRYLEEAERIKLAFLATEKKRAEEDAAIAAAKSSVPLVTNVNTANDSLPSIPETKEEPVRTWTEFLAVTLVGVIPVAGPLGTCIWHFHKGENLEGIMDLICTGLDIYSLGSFTVTRSAATTATQMSLRKAVSSRAVTKVGTELTEELTRATVKAFSRKVAERATTVAAVKIKCDISKHALKFGTMKLGEVAVTRAIGAAEKATRFLDE